MVFNDDDFCPAEVTDRPLPLQENSNNNLSVEQCRDSVPPTSPQKDMPVSRAIKGHSWKHLKIRHG